MKSQLAAQNAVGPAALLSRHSSSLANIQLGGPASHGSHHAQSKEHSNATSLHAGEPGAAHVYQ